MGFSDRSCEYCELIAYHVMVAKPVLTASIVGWPVISLAVPTPTARILILDTKCDNLAAYLPLIREMWAPTPHRVKELYWDEGAGRMALVKRSCNSPTPTMREVALYAAHQFQKGSEATKPDEYFWRKVHCGWRKERGDVQEFWEDMARDRITQKRVIRAISVIPSPQ